MPDSSVYQENNPQKNNKMTIQNSADINLYSKTSQCVSTEDRSSQTNLIVLPDESANLVATDNSAGEISWVYLRYWISIAVYFLLKKQCAMSRK